VGENESRGLAVEEVGEVDGKWRLPSNSNVGCGGSLSKEGKKRIREKMNRNSFRSALSLAPKLSATLEPTHTRDIK